jgi:protein required for attachment to host cells
MSRPVRLPHGAWILVADGRKALLLANEGDSTYPDLRMSRTMESAPNPRTSAQGTDRPGRTVSSSHRRSAVGQTDWHRLAEAEFAAKVVDTFFAGDPPPTLVLIAPPAFLAELRKHLPAPARAAILVEVDKDFMHLPVDEIERRVLALDEINAT